MALARRPLRDRRALAREALGRAAIGHAILLASPTNAQLFRASLRSLLRSPRAALRVFALGKLEALYHQEDFIDEMFFSNTLSNSELAEHLARVRSIRYPRFSMPRVFALGSPAPVARDARVDAIVGSLDPTCGAAKTQRGESLTVIDGAPHDLMLGPAWMQTAERIVALIDAHRARAS